MKRERLIVIVIIVAILSWVAGFRGGKDVARLNSVAEIAKLTEQRDHLQRELATCKKEVDQMRSEWTEEEK